MTTDPLEPFELKEQSKASSRPAPSDAPVTAYDDEMPSELADEIAPSAQPAGPRLARMPHLALPRRLSFGAGDTRLLGFAAAFAIGVVATLFLLSAVALGFSSAYDNKVLPGVHAGSVDLSGLTRDEAIAKLQTGYAYLAQGEVTVTTPVGAASITYQQAGRGPDVEAMADAAMSVGHSGNPIADAASVIHTAAFGQSLPVVILVDPNALALRIHQLVGTSSVAAQDAQATAKGGNFSIAPSAQGRGIDERAMGSAIIDQLTQTTAPADVQAGGTFTSLTPQVTDTDAQNAIARAQKMIVDVKLTWNTKPESVTGAWTPKSWTITAAQIRGWIVFGLRPDGSYAPAVDPAQVEAYLSAIASKASVAPTEPVVTWDADGNLANVTNGKDGVGIDLGGTTQLISAYLDTLASGGTVDASVEVATGPIHPQIATIDNVKSMVVIGSKTITFFPSDSNGNGANIRVPAKNLNGQVVGPGQPFSFLAAVGPIDAAHGFALGGVIVGGKSDHQGAIGGGICSASTTMFNAAANAGLQIDERHAHFYYINRYPVGRDATVYSNGSTTWDLRWTNDTPYPIVIRSWATYGSQSSITIQLWSMATNRTVTWSGGVEADPVKATDNPPVYVKTLKPGITYRAEYPTDGFKTSVGRVVTDSTGAVIHHDVWGSVYGVVNGQLQIGGTPPPSGSPSPTPGAPTPTPGAPTPAPTPVPTDTPVPPAPTPSPARRRKAK
jgi:vancomycin resistance protein YoaR